MRRFMTDCDYGMIFNSIIIWHGGIFILIGKCFKIEIQKQ
jgi:hypothetical protein